MLKDTQNNNELTELRKIDPNLANIISNEIERKEPSQEYQKKMFDALKAYEKNGVKQETGRTFIWQEWVKPIITPIKEFCEWFRLQGFPIVDFRVAVVATTIMMFCFGAYFFLYKNNEEPVLISKNTTPNGLETPTKSGERGYDIVSLKAINSIYVEAKEDQEKQEEVNKLVSLVFKKLNDDNPLESTLNIISDKKADHDAVLRISINKDIVNVEVVSVEKIPHKSVGARIYPLTDLDTLSSAISKDFMSKYNSKSK